MWNALKQIWYSHDLRKNILYVLAMIVVFRLAAHIPLPGVDLAALRNIIGGNQFFGLLNVFSGGTIENFSIVALGVAPYITASIIFQLLGMTIPKLEALMKEGEAGQRIINQYTRLLAVPLAALQGYGLIALLSRSGGATPFAFTTFTLATTITALAAGTIFLMWIGELISERKVGNGISILIFAGIVAGLPQFVRQVAATFDTAQAVNLVIFVAIAIVTVIGVVLISEGQRNIPVSYARRMVGARNVGAVQSYLPLRVNMAGVIPIIFAISIMLFPPVVGQFFVGAQTPWVADAAQWLVSVFNNQLVYGILYFVLVFGFTYFYTAVIFQPDQIAENMQKQGGFVPGIRPGKPTSDYLGIVMTRVNFGGALFLGLIAVLPLLVQQVTGTSTLVIGGTSLLIVVNVVTDSIKQVESQLIMRDYEVY